MTITRTEARGAQLLAENVNYIITHPECWNQRLWHCGTSHCIAGLAQIRTGSPVVDGPGNAATLYDLTPAQADWLFDTCRTLTELWQFATAHLGGYDRDDRDRAGYSRAGRDRAGYNRAGRDRDGYDRDGYDRDGYNRDGRDRDGRDRAGYDRAGYYRDGYDRAGYDRVGYCRDGYDRAGYDRAGYNRRALDRNGNRMPLIQIRDGDE
jgi:hypothetical protein